MTDNCHTDPWLHQSLKLAFAINGAGFAHRGWYHECFSLTVSWWVVSAICRRLQEPLTLLPFENVGEAGYRKVILVLDDGVAYRRPICIDPMVGRVAAEG